MGDPALIEAKSLTKRYDTVLALDHVSFAIGRGEVVGLLGPNGAGKSTAMRTLVGYILPTEGTATLAGYDVLDNPTEVQRRLGYLPESNPLHEEMEVTEYLEFVGAMRSLRSPELGRRMKEVVGLCGLAQAVGKDIGELSKGYRQRVGFAAAILHDPEILILDEPTSGLDPNQVREMRLLIAELRKQKTLILSTHILSEVQASCDRVIIINQGHIVADGKTAELAARVRSFYAEIKGPVEDLEPALRALPGVQSVTRERVEDPYGVFRIEVEPDRDPREDLFRLAVEKRWTLRELHAAGASLEEIFTQLTKGKGGA